MNKVANDFNLMGSSALKSPRVLESPAVKASLRPKRSEQGNFAQSFSQIVAVLMRDPKYRTMRLAELEWLVLPPVMMGQFALAHTSIKHQAASPSRNLEKPQTRESTIVPVAVALWACVSDKLDKTLSDSLASQPRLQPGDWTSGDHPWLMTVAGDPRALPKFIEQLAAKDFKGRRAKIRTRGPDGKVSIKVLGQAA